MKAASNLNLRLTNHAHTIAISIDQMFSIWTVVNRVARLGQVISANQKVRPNIGLKAITVNVAKQIFDEKIKRSLELEKHADFAILDKNSLSV